MLERVIADADEDHEAGAVSVLQNVNSGELGATVWDAALVLLAAVSHGPLFSPLVHGRSVLDLSCGTGAVGIGLLKRRGPRPVSVTLSLSDRSVLVDLIAGNVARNGVAARVVAFDWGGDIRAFGSGVPFDVVLASDVVTGAYAADYPALLQSLRALTHDESTIVLAVELRTAHDADFLRLLVASGFAVDVVPDDELHPDWRSPDIRLFLARKHYGADDDLYK